MWLLAWPILYYFKLGVITGPKAWFWIIGELNYPVVAIAYCFIDSFIKSTGIKPIAVFIVTVLIIAVFTPFYFERYGFALGVSIEARYF